MKIDPDSEMGLSLGFTSDKFNGWLWQVGREIYVSMIESKDPGHGNLSRLFEQIEHAGFGVVVPTPLGRMKKILERKGFKPGYEFSEDMGLNVQVWRK